MGETISSEARRCLSRPRRRRARARTTIQPRSRLRKLRKPPRQSKHARAPAMSSKIRMKNAEIRVGKTPIARLSAFGLRASEFFWHLSFVIRHSEGRPSAERTSRCISRVILAIAAKTFLLTPLVFGLIAFAVRAEDPKPVSYYHDIVPIFKRSCTGCHHPDKRKGELDLTTFASFKKGGKHGPSFKPGEPDASRVLEEISGEEPNMPKEGDPLTKEEVALIERWIKAGAKDDTPPEANSFKLSAPPVYTVLPAISAMA